MGLLGGQTSQDYYEASVFGGYQYTSIKEIVENFIVAYVADGKLIDRVAITNVIFQAKRGLQESSYDVLKQV